MASYDSLYDTLESLGVSPISLPAVHHTQRESYMQSKFRKVPETLKRTFGEASGIKSELKDSLEEKTAYADGVLEDVKTQLLSARGPFKMQLLTLVPDLWNLTKVV